jgi:hypothetical protein
MDSSSKISSGSDHAQFLPPFEPPSTLDLVQGFDICEDTLVVCTSDCIHAVIELDQCMSAAKIEQFIGIESISTKLPKLQSEIFCVCPQYQ